MRYGLYTALTKFSKEDKNPVVSGTGAGLHTLIEHHKPPIKKQSSVFEGFLKPKILTTQPPSMASQALQQARNVNKKITALLPKHLNSLPSKTNVETKNILTH